MKLSFVAKILLIIIFSYLSVYPAVQLDIYQYDQSQNISIDIAQYPLFKSKLRVYQNGSAVRVTKDNVIVVEDCWSGRALSVSAPDIDGWQEVTWYTKIKGPHQKADFYVIYNNESAAISGFDKLEDMSQVRMTNSADDDEPDMQFGIIPVGSDSTRGIIMNAPMALKIGGQEQPVMIDSVKTHSPYFTYEWRGSSISKVPPPTKIISPFYYRIRINFKPQENKFYRDKFSVYYEGGKVEEINLIGNYYPIDRNTVLKLVEPNGGQIFRPCEMVTIKWKGNVKGIPTAIFYSVDNGQSWKYITSSLDSVYKWKIPNEPSKNVLVKVKQEYQNTSERTLTANNIPVRRVAYRSDGLSALSANYAGKIFQWDLTDFTLKTTYSVDEISYPFQNIVPLGLDFTNKDSSFVMAYYKIAGNKRQDSLAFFKVGVTDPVLKIPIDKDFLTKRMLLDARREKFALVPQFGNTLLILDSKNGQELQRVSFNAPITGFAFNAALDEAAVALVTGEIHILSTSDFSIKSTLNFSDLPMIIEIGLSQNGKFIALGCKAPTPNLLVGNRNEIHVAETQSGMIVRTMRNISSNPVGLEFNPSSNVLVIGAAAQPQISMWDLPTSEFIGSMSGNENLLTDFKFSPEGHSILTSSSSSDNLVIRFFTYPEDDSSDNVFSIVAPEIEVNKHDIAPKYMATRNDYDTTVQFCNTGIVPLVIDDAWMYHGVHFKLLKSFRNDTLEPGECLKIAFTYNPLDTGKITDSLVVSTCIGLFYLPMESYSWKRNISFLRNSFDFGDLCVGDTIDREFELARNDDPVDLIVNRVVFDDIYNNPFLIIKNLKDSIIKPGEKIIISARFIPRNLGLAKRSFVINHSNQLKFTEIAPVTGNGIGSLLDISHNDLRFIPEISQRTIKVKNSTPNEIILTKFNFSTAGIFSVSNPLPLSLQPGEEKELTLVWNLTPSPDVKLSFEATPCMVINVVTVGMYFGTSNVSLPKVEADPKGEAVIPISFENISRELYKGKRFFEPVFYINPRMFLPTSVKSDFGEATILKNEVINDRRLIQIRVEGDFPEKGVVAEISGIAGLAETDFSLIEFDNNSAFWGRAVQTTTNNGSFKLINLCGDRRILQNNSINILSISPNPAKDEFEIEYSLDDNSPVSYEIYDNLGVRFLNSENITGVKGKNTIYINSQIFLTGTYKIILKKKESFCVGSVMIIK